MERVREENFNVILAELLAESGLKALGEVILKRKKRPTPDILVEINGVKIVIEGKKPGFWNDLENNCRDRLENDVCDLCMMVEYAGIQLPGIWQYTGFPSETEIKNALLKGKFNIGFMSYIDLLNLDKWMGIKSTNQVYRDVGFQDMVTYLMSAYDRVVREDIIQPVISRMDQVLADFAESLAGEVDVARLKDVLEITEKGDNEDADE